jgi:hypothetical protein
VRCQVIPVHLRVPRTVQRMPSIMPAVSVYNSCTPSMTFPLKFLEKCFFFRFVVLFSFFIKLKFFILGPFIPRILRRPFATLLTLIILFAVHKYSNGGNMRILNYMN